MSITFGCCARYQWILYHIQQGHGYGAIVSLTCFSVYKVELTISGVFRISAQKFSIINTVSVQVFRPDETANNPMLDMVPELPCSAIVMHQHGLLLGRQPRKYRAVIKVESTFVAIPE
jgi:hypothetical protein